MSKAKVMNAFIIYSSIIAQICNGFDVEIKDIDKCCPEAGHKSIADLLQARGLKTGVELGVKQGSFAEKMLQTWTTCEKYYLVDIWAQQKNYKDLANVEDNIQEEYYLEAKQKMTPFADKAVFIRNWTSSAVLEFGNHSLDFVYVDARHDYCGALNDIELWYPKLKVGGILAGHDYVDADWGTCEDGSNHKGGVKAAVNKFAADHHFLVKTTNDRWPCWIYHRKQKHQNEITVSSSSSVENKLISDQLTSQPVNTQLPSATINSIITTADANIRTNGSGALFLRASDQSRPDSFPSISSMHHVLFGMFILTIVYITIMKCSRLTARKVQVIGVPKSITSKLMMAKQWVGLADNGSSNK